MSKSAGFAMPKDRKAEAVQTFVDQGKPDDTAAPAKPSPRTPAGGPQTRLNVDLPADLHRQFKTACAAGGVRMSDIVTALVQEWIAKNRGA